VTLADLIDAYISERNDWLRREDLYGLQPAEREAMKQWDAAILAVQSSLPLLSPYGYDDSLMVS
jgi:hypothetical protein